MRDITIQVTDKHINEGIKSACNFCPVALAVKEILKEEFFPIVINSFIGICNKKNEISSLYDGRDILQKILLTQEISGFIENFDFGQTVKPISFNISIEEKYLKETNVVNLHSSLTT